MFGFGKKNRERFVVATVVVCVDGDGFLPVQRRINEATARIVDAADAHGDGFAVAAREVADVARVLLDHEAHWCSAALAGEVFSREEDAGAHLGDVYADLSSRYASSEGAQDAVAAEGTSRERRCVAMLTVAYQGERADVERELHDRLDLARVLRGIVALHEQDALLAAQTHVAPSHPEDRLTDEQLLANFPELVTL